MLRIRHLLPLLLAVVAVLVVACGKATPGREVPAPSASVGTLPARLPIRAEAVALADALALAGARADAAEGVRLTLQAAELRQRLWRMERREADGLEAIELYDTVARHDPTGACAVSVEQALLRGEIEQDPGAAYAGVYLARAKARTGPCVKRADAVLTTLAAFKPLPNVIAELDHQATGEGGKPPSKAAAQAHLDHRGTVVVPRVDSAPQGPLRVTTVERYGSEEAARIVVNMTRPATFDVGFLARNGATDPRLYVDIKGAKYKGPLEFDVGGLVKRVRMGQRKNGTRVVLDLERAAFRKIFYLPEPFRMVIDVSTSRPREIAPPSKGPRPVRRVVLDPGHGGDDPGATGPAGLKEKDVTLDIAHRAAPLLARELGVSTLLTRDSDDFVALDERTARANAFKADLFVSIHCNATEAGDTRGVMTFVLDESQDRLASQTAALENAASPAAAAELASALSQVVDQGSVARSVHFAELLQRAAVASIEPAYPGVPDLGVRRAGFYVLAGAHMPAVLFEVSFISDSTDEMRLNTGDYRQKLADAIVNAVRAYREGV
jgi:N-acetylmuramoyl-L-alanine amidase